MEPSIDEVIEWLEWGVPSDFVILKESAVHLRSPEPTDRLAFDLLTIVRFVYPKGEEELIGKKDIYKDMVRKLKLMK